MLMQFNFPFPLFPLASIIFFPFLFLWSPPPTHPHLSCFLSPFAPLLPTRLLLLLYCPHSQVHDECDMGWQRLVIHRRRLPGKPEAGGHCSQQGKRVGEGRIYVCVFLGWFVCTESESVSKKCAHIPVCSSEPSYHWGHVRHNISRREFCGLFYKYWVFKANSVILTVVM